LCDVALSSTFSTISSLKEEPPKPEASRSSRETFVGSTRGMRPAVLVVFSCLLLAAFAQEKETCEKKGCPVRNGKPHRCVRIVDKDNAKSDYLCMRDQLIRKAQEEEKLASRTKRNCYSCGR